MANSEQPLAVRGGQFAQQNASPIFCDGEAFIHGWIVASVGIWQGSTSDTAKAPPGRSIQYAKELI